MAKYFKYKYDWNTFNLIVDCTKCGNNIVLQDFDGYPVCSDCGNTNKISWAAIIKKVDIIGMKRGNAPHKKMQGHVEGNANLDQADDIKCYHCKSVLALPEDEEIKNYSCNTCNQPVHFKTYEDLEDLVFYRDASRKDASQEAAKMIAVRCVSCGAPLEVDPTKNNFNCKFCSTENILPVALRYKIVLADIYVGEISSKYLKLTTFQQDGKLIKQSLRENGRESFADSELDKVLLNNKNDITIYNQITNEFKYLPSDKILNEIFTASTNQQIIGLVGTRLQKSNEEIETRIIQVNPKFNQKKEPILVSTQAPLPRKKGFFKFSVFLVIVFLVVMTLLMITGTI